MGPEMGEVVWVRNVLLIGLVLTMTFSAVAAVYHGFLLDSHQEHIADKEVLLHTRILQLTERVETLAKDLGELRILIDPHKRVTEMERWQRTFCSGDKIEACALLRKVQR